MRRSLYSLTLPFLAALTFAGAPSLSAQESAGWCFGDTDLCFAGTLEVTQALVTNRYGFSAISDRFMVAGGFTGGFTTAPDVLQTTATFFFGYTNGYGITEYVEALTVLQPGEFGDFGFTYDTYVSGTDDFTFAGAGVQVFGDGYITTDLCGLPGAAACTEPTVSVPEPGVLGLLAAGLVGLIGAGFFSLHADRSVGQLARQVRPRHPPVAVDAGQ